jgi:hypothetical protein
MTNVACWFLHHSATGLYETGQGIDEWITLAEQVAGVRGEVGPVVQTTGRPTDFDGLDQG